MGHLTQVWCENKSMFETTNLVSTDWCDMYTTNVRDLQIWSASCLIRAEYGTTPFFQSMTIHFQVPLPLQGFSPHPRLPPSMWKVLGKASSNMSCINRPNLEPTSSQVPQLEPMGVAGISSGWWRVTCPKRGLLSRLFSPTQSGVQDHEISYEYLPVRNPQQQ